MAGRNTRHFLCVLDNNGAVVVNYIYDAWGNNAVVDNNGNDVTSGIGVLNPFRYRGYYYDTETELYYLQTRYYDPEIGRFISQDSLEYADPETINGLNLYAYCGNNPVMNIDPTGTFWGIFIAIIALLAFTPAGGVVAQTVVSTASYIGMAVASIFDKDIRDDMNAIGWNPFNTDENAVIGSKKVSFYKGMPVYRTNNNRSGTFYAIMLAKGSSIDDLRHERGHGWQSLMMGIGTYGLMIGLPSMFEWSKRQYYDRPWEITADILGGVKNRTHSQQDISRGWWYFAVSNIFGPFGYFFLIHEYK